MSPIPLAPREPQGGTGGAALDTRARIAAAAFELFAAQGYDGTTVDAIAERAGIARRTFFRYFRSKDDVIFADHDTLLATVNENLATQSEMSRCWRSAAGSGWSSAVTSAIPPSRCSATG